MQMHLTKAQYVYFKSMPIFVNIIKVEMKRISSKTRQEMFITAKNKYGLMSTLMSSYL